MNGDDRPIYLDGLSTTPLDPRVLDAMLPWLRDRFGNAASHTHAFGHDARDAVERARAQVASLIGADPAEIVFTSGATEANNLAIKGTAEAIASPGALFVCGVAEHRSVLDPMATLARRGHRVLHVGVDEGGSLREDDLGAALAAKPALVSFMHANNETGVISDVARLASMCAEAGVLLHTDATQAVGKIPVDVRASGVAMASFSAHKLHGPKGIGALYVRRGGSPRVRLVAQMDGGGHERGRRSGTLNVPAIVGFGEAAALCIAEGAADASRMAALRDRLRDRLFSNLTDLIENGDASNRLPNALNLSIAYVQASALIDAMPGLAISTGSACSSVDPEPSHVLVALGGEERARTAIRFGLTRYTTESEIDRAAEMVIRAATALRQSSDAFGIG